VFPNGRREPDGRLPAAGRLDARLPGAAKEGARAPCVLVIQEAFGLNDHIKGRGAPDRGRGLRRVARISTGAAGRSHDPLRTSSPEAIALISPLKDPEIVSDLGSAVAYLEKQAFVRAPDRDHGLLYGRRVAYLACVRPPLP